MNDSDSSRDSSSMLSLRGEDEGLGGDGTSLALTSDDDDDDGESDGTTFSFALSPTESEIRVMNGLERGFSPPPPQPPPLQSSNEAPLDDLLQKIEAAREALQERRLESALEHDKAHCDLAATRRRILLNLRDSSGDLFLPDPEGSSSPTVERLLASIDAEIDACARGLAGVGSELYEFDGLGEDEEEDGGEDGGEDEDEDESSGRHSPKTPAVARLPPRSPAPTTPPPTTIQAATSPQSQPSQGTPRREGGGTPLAWLPHVCPTATAGATAADRGGPPTVDSAPAEALATVGGATGAGKPRRPAHQQTAGLGDAAPGARRGPPGPRSKAKGAAATGPRSHTTTPVASDDSENTQPLAGRGGGGGRDDTDASSQRPRAVLSPRSASLSQLNVSRGSAVQAEAEAGAGVGVGVGEGEEEGLGGSPTKPAPPVSNQHSAGAPPSLFAAAAPGAGARLARPARPDGPARSKQAFRQAPSSGQCRHGGGPATLPVPAHASTGGAAEVAAEAAPPPLPPPPVAKKVKPHVPPKRPYLPFPRQKASLAPPVRGPRAPGHREKPSVVERLAQLYMRDLLEAILDRPPVRVEGKGEVASGEPLRPAKGENEKQQQREFTLFEPYGTELVSLNV